MLLALLLAACTPERPSCFTATGTLRVGSRRAQVRVISRDLPEPGNVNRWAYEIAEGGQALAGVENGPHSATVCATADVRGGERVEVAGAWRLELQPTARHVADWFAARAGKQRCRVLEWSVVRTPGRLEILLEEPGSLGQGRTGP